jgi:2Fe-2S ferredoxin
MAVNSGAVKGPFMPIVNYIQLNDETLSVEVFSGDTVMQGAMDNMVEGIVAECGGGCNCATCHVFVDPEWLERVGVAVDMEKDLLDNLPIVQPNSRLSCQIEVTPELDGLVVRVPAAQY